jgi:Restriction endonuclease
MSKYSDAINFEKLIMSLYQAILKADGYNTEIVQHDVTLPCKSGATAQFDIYWEFKQGVTLHKVAIECKHYNSTVEVAEVREFAQKLADVGNVRGVMVTRKGYQAGAKAVARDNNINLCLYQYPEEMDWSGRIKEVTIEITALLIQNARPEFIFDIDPQKEKKRFVFRETTNRIEFVDSENNVITNLHKMEMSLPTPTSGGKDLRHNISFDKPTFLKISHMPRAKIKEVRFIYDVRTSTETLKISATDFIRGLLIDDETKESFLHYTDGSVAPRTTLDDAGGK